MTLPDLEYCACPLCRGSAFEPHLQAPDRFALAAGLCFQLQRCRNCGMIVLNPRPAERDSGVYYQNQNYLPFASAGAPRTPLVHVYDFVRRFNLRWKRKLVSRFSSRGRLLDLGCGTGEFLAEMRQAGWQVYGLERDAGASAWAREHFKLAVDTGSLQEWIPPVSAFEAITLWHVLEHLYEPLETLRTLHRLLAPAGVLLIAVPNIGGLDAQVYRQHWIALDAPRHVNHFTLETLAVCAATAGFALRWWQQLPLDAFFNSLMSEKLAAEMQRTAWWQWPLRLLRAGMVSVSSLLAGGHHPFAAKFRGATIVAMFQKA